MKKKLFTLLLQCLIANAAFSQSLPLPYYSGFDNTSEQDGWQEFRLGVLSTNTWGYGINSCSAPTALSHDYNVGGSATDTVEDWFVSPPLKIENHAKLTFKISPSLFGTELEIWFGTGSNNPSGGNFVQLAYFDLPYTVFNQCLDTFVDITTVTDTGYIGFRYVGSDYNAFDIDNINITATTTIINEEDKVNKISVNVFPNPFRTATTIFIDGKISDSPLEIRMHDILGREVKRIDEIRSRVINIASGNLPSGLYFISIIREDKTIDSRKVLVQ